jgi:HSP20 family protein
MAFRESGPGLLAEAIELLREADRMHRHFFTLALGHGGPCWEPPADIVESERAVVVRIALPGVAHDAVSISTDGARLHVIGVRPLPTSGGETIHRLEIPYGRFERRIDLPPGRYDTIAHELADGLLVLTLRRSR